MTQLESAKNKEITNEVDIVSKRENLDSKFVMELVASGRVVILKNNSRKNALPTGIGENLMVKINGTVGTTNKNTAIKQEIEKAELIESLEVDTLTDLSTGKGVDLTRKKIINSITIPIGSTPFLQTIKEVSDKTCDLVNIDKDYILSNIEKHLRDGVDFITLHAGMTKNNAYQYDETERKMGLVSRSGSILNWWMKQTEKENPMYENFNEILDLLKMYDAVLSLGNGYRAGCICDFMDRAQTAELIVNGELVQRARQMGVQVMVEGGGYVPYNKIEVYTKTIKEITSHAPLYMLGPIVTDIGIGYDDYTSAIGSVQAGLYGADFISVITSSEGMDYPNMETLKRGITVSKLVAHSINISRGIKEEIKRDDLMAVAKRSFNTKDQKKYAIDSTVF